GAILLRLFRRGAEMRQRRDLRMPEELRRGEIAYVGVQASAVEGRDHGRVVNDRAAREIDQYRLVGHEREAVAVDEVACRLDQRHVQGDRVAALEQVVERIGL